MNYQDFQKEGVISTLSQTEKETYCKFHKQAYKDDLKVTKQLLAISPRWTIISGYYAMHDITKLFLAKNHNLKISDRGAHLAVIVALRQMLIQTELRKQAIELLKEAEKTYNIFATPLKEKIIPNILSKGRQEREKSQYYTEKNEKIILSKSTNFHEHIVKPYIILMEKLLE